MLWPLLLELFGQLQREVSLGYHSSEMYGLVGMVVLAIDINPFTKKLGERESLIPLQHLDSLFLFLKSLGCAEVYFIFHKYLLIPQVTKQNFHVMCLRVFV